MRRPFRKPDRASTVKHFQPGERYEDGPFFQPWLVSRETYLAIARLVPREYVQKMRAYFDDYGCIRCDGRKALYGGNGMCDRCHAVIWKRLFLCWRRRVRALSKETHRQEMKSIVTNARIAHALLEDLIPTRQPIRRQIGMKNPAAELVTLAARTRYALHRGAGTQTRSGITR
ncbi:MAG TPA: hypothetical protein VEJ46_03950 [Candidatus Acidoferrum sp.]|nr:hypothetical protein [Candidatus Acidoferrum sp.]